MAHLSKRPCNAPRHGKGASVWPRGRAASGNEAAVRIAHQAGADPLRVTARPWHREARMEATPAAEATAVAAELTYLEAMRGV